MFKRYFLAVADAAFASGLLIGIATGFGVGLVGCLVTKSPEFFFGAILLGLGGGFLLGIINSITRHTQISYETEDGGVFIKVGGRGQVVEAGNPLWGRGERIYWCRLPWIWEEGTFDVIVSLSQSLGDVCVAMDVVLTASVDKEWDYQELYDKVDYDSVDAWLGASFKKAAEASVGVQQAFENFADAPQSVTFVDALTKALRAVPFSGQPLSNISGVIARVKADSATYTAKVRYN